MTKKFIDHATFSVSLLFSEYYFKLYINVNKIIADVLFLYPQSDWHAVTQIKGIPQNFQFYQSKVFRVSRNFWDQSGYIKQTII